MQSFTDRIPSRLSQMKFGLFGIVFKKARAVLATLVLYIAFTCVYLAMATTRVRPIGGMMQDMWIPGGQTNEGSKNLKEVWEFTAIIIVHRSLALLYYFICHRSARKFRSPLFMDKMYWVAVVQSSRNLKYASGVFFSHMDI